MTQLLLWGSLALLCGGLIWAIAKISETAGAARAMREQAEREAENVKKAGVEVARHTDTGDTIGRLQSGQF